MSKRPVFSSSMATVLTMIGVAVGLGNVWRFPYMMGRYGGSAFLLVYLLFTIIFATPALMGEIALGRETKEGPIGAFSKALGKKWGRGIGYILLLTIMMASSYYVVVIANVVYTAFYAMVYGFEGGNIAGYEAQLNNGWLQFAIAVAIFSTCLLIIYRGLNKGIELVSKIFVPFFLLAILYLIYTAFSLEGAPQYFQEFLKPDFSSLTATNIFAALGQAFYSLGLGGTFMLVYGSYLKDNQNIPKTAFLTNIGDVGAALLASLFIVPTVLVFGVDITSGPRLIFSTLPHLFGEMGGGQWVGLLFMLALSLVAMLSLIGAFEVAANEIIAISKQKWSRKKTIIIVGLIQFILVLPSALNPNLIGVLDLVFGSGMQVIGSGLALIALSWGMGKMKVLGQVFGGVSSPISQFYFHWIRWVVPAVLLIVLIGYIYSSLI